MGAASLARAAIVAMALLVLGGSGGAAGQPADRAFRPLPSALLPKQSLRAEDVAVVVNDRDPLSIEIGRYYQARRQIPADQVIHLSFAPRRASMRPAELKALRAELAALTPAAVQAYVLTWAEPYRVGCMSITAAFTFGYDEAYCASGCELTRASRYFGSSSVRPYDDYGIRPAMVLAALTSSAGHRLIDRGIESDGAWPRGTAYLVSTSDAARNVRARGYDAVAQALDGVLKVERVEADAISGRSDVLFYFVGAARVPKIESNVFLPGAVADHLTSTGGQLTRRRGQMSCLRWLEAGATGSYGTVVEPCNFTAKFPDPLVLARSYLAGSTVIEAYWRSVLMPGQGIFVGEPLAAPYGGYRIALIGGAWVLSTYALVPGPYRLESAHSPVGPYRLEKEFTKRPIHRLDLVLPDPISSYYRVKSALTK